MSTVNTMTLTEFLLARIAEDEAAAERGRSHNGGGTFANDNYGYLLVQPARVLAECAAKRQAIEAAWGDQVQIEGEVGSLPGPRGDVCEGRQSGGRRAPRRRVRRPSRLPRRMAALTQIVRKD
jgi:hypothetical protein